MYQLQMFFFFCQSYVKVMEKSYTKELRSSNEENIYLKNYITKKRRLMMLLQRMLVELKEMDTSVVDWAKLVVSMAGSY